MESVTNSSIQVEPTGVYFGICVTVVPARHLCTADRLVVNRTSRLLLRRLDNIDLDWHSRLFTWGLYKVSTQKVTGSDLHRRGNNVPHRGTTIVPEVLVSRFPSVLCCGPTVRLVILVWPFQTVVDVLTQVPVFEVIISVTVVDILFFSNCCTPFKLIVTVSLYLNKCSDHSPQQRIIRHSLVNLIMNFSDTHWVPMLSWRSFMLLLHDFFSINQ